MGSDRARDAEEPLRGHRPLRNVDSSEDDPHLISGDELAELLRDRPELLRLEVDEGRELDAGRHRWVVHADGRLRFETFEPEMGGGAKPGSTYYARMTSAQAIALFRAVYDAGLTEQRDEEWEDDPTGSFDICILGVSFQVGERYFRASVVGPRHAGLVQIAARVWAEFETRGLAVPEHARFAWLGDTMGIPERYTRWIRPDTRERVAGQARVASDAGMQDWPCEVADVARMPDFLAGYRDAETDDERFAWMALCLESLEFSDDGIETWWGEVEPLLRASPRLHAHWILSWSCVGACSDERWRFDRVAYALAAPMRRVLVDCYEAIGFTEFDALCVPSAEEMNEVERLVADIGGGRWSELDGTGRLGGASAHQLASTLDDEGVPFCAPPPGTWDPTLADAVLGGAGVLLLSAPLWTTEGASSVVLTVRIERSTDTQAPPP